MGGLPSIPSFHGGDVAATTAFAVIENQYTVHRCSTRVVLVRFTRTIQMF